MTKGTPESEKRGTAGGVLRPLESAVLPDPAKPIAAQDLAILLAICIFGEARGESGLAQRAVAQVILNRAHHPRAAFGARKGAAFDENLRNVILQPQQFSSLNPFDPNYPGLLDPLAHEEPEVWRRCLDCAEQALAGQDRPDTLTANSDHYFDDSIQPPPWADPAKQTVKVGRLNFYRLYLPPPQGGSAAEPETKAPGLSYGSRQEAKVSASGPESSAAAGGDTLARSRQIRDASPMSLSAPQSLSASGPAPARAGTTRGQGQYPRYDWSGRLSTLMAGGSESHD